MSNLFKKIGTQKFEKEQNTNFLLKKFRSRRATKFVNKFTLKVPFLFKVNEKKCHKKFDTLDSDKFPAFDDFYFAPWRPYNHIFCYTITVSLFGPSAAKSIPLKESCVRQCSSTCKFILVMKEMYFCITFYITVLWKLLIWISPKYNLFEVWTKKMFQCTLHFDGQRNKYR